MILFQGPIDSLRQDGCLDFLWVGLSHFSRSLLCKVLSASSWGRPLVAGDGGAEMGQVSLLTASESSECLVPC